MGNINIKNGEAATKYLAAKGIGTSGDPFLPLNADFYAEVVAGNVVGAEIIHKFGHNTTVGSGSYTPLTGTGSYETPQVSGATTLRVKAGGHANDTAAGSGAREITVEGLDETGAYATETIATAGASASAATTITFMRLFRAWVSASGTYATAAAGSHAATVTIEDGGGTTDWAEIHLNGFAEAQSAIGAYSVPLGKTAYVINISITVDSAKTASVFFFQRENILETAAPYTAMRVISELGGITGVAPKPLKAPLGPFPALTDIGAMAKMSTGTGEVDVDFEILLLDE